jgi:hypothetical protein
VGALFFLAFSVDVSAQEALRQSLAGERAAAQRHRALENQAYNIRLGMLQFSLGSALGIEFNDNVNLAERDEQEDVVLRPQLDTALRWPLTERNALNFSVGVGYDKYLNESRYDRFRIAPGSELSFDLFIKDLRLTFFDRFSYTQDPLATGSISGTARYGGLENVGGLNATLDLNKVVLLAGYGRSLWRRQLRILTIWIAPPTCFSAGSDCYRIQRLCSAWRPPVASPSTT